MQYYFSDLSDKEAWDYYHNYYKIYDKIKGSDYSDTEQYGYGFEAGCILRKIHSIPAPESLENWEIRFNRKMDRKIEKYKTF